jgi:predicted AlkP superfamily phosphohydrolase/phosphomutase
VNLAGRERNGVVPPEKLEEYVERIVAACEGLRDPVTGEPIFERVLRNSELGEVHLGHPRAAGDVWVNARPGYALSGRIEPLAPRARDKPRAPVLEPAGTLRGQHGYLGTNREVQAIFFAGGPKVRPGGIGTVRHVDVAPTVSALLGIEPPAQNQGRNVLADQQ